MYPTTDVVKIAPQAGPQERFLSSPADIVIYGGSAGGGKTWGLLLDPLRDIHNGGFNAVIFRRTYAEVTNAGGLWDESEQIYPYAGGRGLRGDLRWRFPSGARIDFGHVQYDSDLVKYDGAQIGCLLIDQLEHFSERAYWYLQMRNRSASPGVKPRLRATCNPPDPSDEGSDWLPDFLSWWIASDGYADMSRAGQIRWMVRWSEQIYWADSRDELIARFPAVLPQSVTFIPATVYDNKILLANDPQYEARLQALPYIERERFLGDRERGGNWKISAEAGKVFNRSWFEVVPGAPSGGVEARGWDMAATVRELKNDDPDYTAGIKVRKVNGIYYVMDAINDRYAAGEVQAAIEHTTAGDLMVARSAGSRYMLRWETEPGSAGLRETERMKRDLIRRFPGINADGVPSTGDKISKSRALAIAAEQGKVKVVAGVWTDSFLNQLHGFPEKKHDDMVDAAAIAYNALADASDQSAQKPQPNPFVKLKGI